MMASPVSAGAEELEDSGFPRDFSAGYAFVRIPGISLSCYCLVMNPVLEDAIIAVTTTLGAWLFAQQLGSILYG
jgi:hypothetical protein